MKVPTWFRLLKMVREIAAEGEIHSKSLGLRAEIDPSDASAWLCKLSRWGYLRRAGRAETGGKSIRYELTKYGAEVKAPKKRHYEGGQP